MPVKCPRCGHGGLDWSDGFSFDCLPPILVHRHNCKSCSLEFGSSSQEGRPTKYLAPSEEPQSWWIVKMQLNKNGVMEGSE